MEGWRISCPVCGAALGDFRLYTRLFRADPSDVLLARIHGSARAGERILDRASKQRSGSCTPNALMRSLLLPQAAPSSLKEMAASMPRLLNLVVPDSDEFFKGWRRKTGDTPHAYCRSAYASRFWLASKLSGGVPTTGWANWSVRPRPHTKRTCCMPSAL